MNHLLYPFMVVAGIVTGLSGVVPGWVEEFSIPKILLCALVVQVGFSLGMRPDLKKVFKGFNLRLLLLPLCTIVGTLTFTFIASLMFRENAFTDIMAIGSGFGYYTLSSMLIGQIKEASVGTEVAATLAAIALLANVVREMIALISCRFLSKRGYGMAAISVAGINSMDVCLPMILGDREESSDSQLVPAAICHGIILEISVPILVSLFCA